MNLNADRNFPPEYVAELLHFACGHGYAEIVDILIDAGMNVNAVMGSRNPLIAISSSEPARAWLLLTIME